MNTNNLKNVYNKAAVAVMAWDENGRIVYANDACCVLLETNIDEQTTLAALFSQLIPDHLIVKEILTLLHSDVRDTPFYQQKINIETPQTHQRKVVDLKVIKLNEAATNQGHSLCYVLETNCPFLSQVSQQPPKRLSEKLKNSLPILEAIEFNLAIFQTDIPVYVNNRLMRFLNISDFSLNAFLAKVPSEISREIQEHLLAESCNYSNEFKYQYGPNEKKWLKVSIEPFNVGGEHFSLLHLEDIHSDKSRDHENMLRVLDTQELERKHFAEELHDGLGPLLSSVNVYLNLIESKTQNQEVLKLINLCADITNNAIVETRRISNDLLPRVLQDYGLEKALSVYIENLNESKAIVVESVFLNLNLLEQKKIELNLYRIAIELINNTLKYANAQTIVLKIKLFSNKLTFFYSDDGIGFQWDEICRKGHGMNNIRSRISVMDGTIEITSSPNEGMQVQIEIDI